MKACRLAFCVHLFAALAAALFATPALAAEMKKIE